MLLACLFVSGLRSQHWKVVETLTTTHLIMCKLGFALCWGKAVKLDSCHFDSWSSKAVKNRQNWQFINYSTMESPRGPRALLDYKRFSTSLFSFSFGYCDLFVCALKEIRNEVSFFSIKITCIMVFCIIYPIFHFVFHHHYFITRFLSMRGSEFIFYSNL